MRKSSFHVIVWTTIALVAATAYVVLRGDRTAVPRARVERVFPGLADRLGDLAWMRLSRGQWKIDFANVAGQWVLVEKGNYPASPARMRRLLVGLSELTLVEPKTRRAELFGRLGLDDPADGNSTLLGLRDRTGGTVAELIVGKVRHDRPGGGASGIYIRKPDGERAWLARGSLDLSGDSILWLDRGIVDIPPARIASVRLTGGDGTAFLLRRDKPHAAFAIVDLPEGMKAKADSGVSEPAAALALLDLDDVKPAVEMDFPMNGVTTVEYATFDGLAIKLRLVEEGGADWVALAASGSGSADAESKSINRRVARWVYAIPAARTKLLRTRLADLIEPAKGS